MRKTLLLGSILLLLTGGIALVYWWSERDPGSAWFVIDSEQVVHDAQPKQQVEVLFHLQNTSSRPFRIVGSTAC